MAPVPAASSAWSWIRPAVVGDLEGQLDLVVASAAGAAGRGREVLDQDVACLVEDPHGNRRLEDVRGAGDPQGPSPCAPIPGVATVIAGSRSS